MLDEREFLSPYGIRAAVAAGTWTEPYSALVDGHEHRVDYEPAESSTGLFVMTDRAEIDGEQLAQERTGSTSSQ